MSEKDRELVLCVPVEDLCASLCDILQTNVHPTGFSVAPQIAFQILELPNYCYVPRSVCETRSQYQQIIPYIMVCVNEQSQNLLVYNRTKKTGEERLLGKKSIGFGGHINPNDGDSLRLAFLKGAKRELEEELGITDRYELRVLGTVKNMDDPVGEVHYGIVLVAVIESRDQVKCEDEGIANLQWRTPDIITDIHEFEKWTTLIMSTNFNGIQHSKVLYKSKCEPNPEPGERHTDKINQEEIWVDYRVDASQVKYENVPFRFFSITAVSPDSARHKAVLKIIEEHKFDNPHRDFPKLYALVRDALVITPVSS